MELRQLEYAVMVYKEKSFTKAAERLHIAQPSLSQQIAKLEREFGLMLFNRTTNPVEATHAGETFVVKAQHILDLVEQVHSEMNDISQLRKGKLVIGTLPITGSHILPFVLPEFMRRYPNIEIALVEDTSINLEQLTSSGIVDLALLTLPIEDPSLLYQPYLTETICLAVPHTHRLVNHDKPIPLKEIAGESFILLKKGQGFRKITQEICMQAGFSPIVVFESSNIETVKSLVAAGMGVAFVPAMVADAKKGKYVPIYKQLTGPVPNRTLVVARRRGRYFSKAAETFIETVIQVAKTLDS
jgi:LysR family hydrogen peroxide-inducible transcriptional activator